MIQGLLLAQKLIINRVKNKKEGNGTYIYKDQSRYTGQWKNNQKEGKGVIEYCDMTGWRGTWVNNKKNGMGEGFTRSGLTF